MKTLQQILCFVILHNLTDHSFCGVCVQESSKMRCSGRPKKKVDKMFRSLLKIQRPTQKIFFELAAEIILCRLNDKRQNSANKTYVAVVKPGDCDCTADPQFFC